MAAAAEVRERNKKGRVLFFFDDVVFSVVMVKKT
jgi:hypothetical protein